MEIYASNDQIDIKHSDREMRFGSFVVIGIGLATILLSPFIKFTSAKNAVIFVIASIAAVATGSIFVYIAKSTHTVIRKDKITVTYLRRYGNKFIQHSYAIDEIQNIEYAVARHDTFVVRTVLISLKLKNGQRIKIGSQPIERAWYMRSNWIYGPQHDNAVLIANFLNVPLNDNLKAWRPLEG